VQRLEGNLIYREFINDDRLDNVQQRCDQLLSHVQPIRDLVNDVETPWNEHHRDGPAADWRGDRHRSGELAGPLRR
jgi:hypothetical protein